MREQKYFYRYETAQDDDKHKLAGNKKILSR
jgi:hypothetical protein